MSQPRGDVSGDVAPWAEWPEVSKLVNKLWDPNNSPHHSIIGLTGSGKSYLGINGILKPMCANDRVLIIDSKGHDELVSTTGHGVTELPRNTWGKHGRKPAPYDSWWRLNVFDAVQGNPVKAQNQVKQALNQVYSEGNWIIFLDEIRQLTDPKRPNLNLGPFVDQIYVRGRSRKISIIAATQAPRWVPTSFYDQASFAWIGRLRDKDKQKRLLEIGGLSTSELPIISALEERQWLLSAGNGKLFRRTKVTV